MIISFSGMDGTGKTYHSTELCKKLASKGVIVRYIHMMSEDVDYTIIRYLLLLVIKAHLGVTTSKGEVQTRAPKNPVVRTIWPLLALLDYLVTFLTRIRPLAKNAVLICDRCYYDYLTSFYALGITNDWSLALAMKFIPKSDQTFFLDSDVDVAFKRIKGELSPEYLGRLRVAYIKMIRMLDPTPKVLNTVKDRDFISTKIFEDSCTLLGLNTETHQ